MSHMTYFDIGYEDYFKGLSVEESPLYYSMDCNDYESYLIGWQTAVEDSSLNIPNYDIEVLQHE